MNIKELNEAIDKALCERAEYIDEWSIYYIDDIEPDECFEEDEAGAWQRFEEVKDKVAQLVKKTYKIDGNEMDTVAEDVLYDYRDKSESVKQTKYSKKSMKEEMEYNRKIWDLFEENIAEYLNEQGVKPDGNNVMNYISENAAEIVQAVLNKNYDYEEDDQAIFELYYNCPIHFTDKAQAIDKLLEEYLAESLKRCLTIEDKLLQISSLDKNESVIEKKSLKEDVNTVYVLINNKVALNFEQDFDFAIEVLDADSLKKRAEELDKNFEQNAKEANLGSPLMNDVLYAIHVLRNNGYFVLVKNIK